MRDPRWTLSLLGQSKFTLAYVMPRPCTNHRPGPVDGRECCGGVCTTLTASTDTDCFQSYKDMCRDGTVVGFTMNHGRYSDALTFIHD